MAACRIETLPELYGSLYHSFSPNIDLQSQPGVVVQVPMVGEGNPATAMAITKRLESFQIPVHSSFLKLSALPAQAWHERMTQSNERSSSYTASSEQQRKGRLAQVFGRLSKLEMDFLLRQFRDLNPNPVLIGVQELQFLALTAPQLLSRFQNAYLYIPDVFPKESAVEILKRLPITALVWNGDARNHLDKQSISVELVEPVLPYAMAEASSFPSEEDPYVLIKSSGSGMPGNLIDVLTTYHRDHKIPFQLWLPDRVELLEGSYPLPAARRERAKAFYDNLLHSPPKAVIAYPSEMVQVFYALAVHGMSMPYLSLPSRGRHEHVNLNWGMKNSVISDCWDGNHSLADFHNKILRKEWESSSVPKYNASSLRDVIARARS